MPEKFQSIVDMSKSEVIDRIHSALREITIEQYQVITINTVILQMSINCSRIGSVDQLDAINTDSLKAILRELWRNLEATIEARKEHLNKTIGDLGIV